MGHSRHVGSVKFAAFCVFKEETSWAAMRQWRQLQAADSQQFLRAGLGMMSTPTEERRAERMGAHVGCQSLPCCYIKQAHSSLKSVVKGYDVGGIRPVRRRGGRAMISLELLVLEEARGRGFEKPSDFIPAGKARAAKQRGGPRGERFRHWPSDEGPNYLASSVPAPRRRR